jgi:hypothetical protein
MVFVDRSHVGRRDGAIPYRLDFESWPKNESVKGNLLALTVKDQLR